ncbi:MAG TPA: DUF58 domain-containing protein, partial [Opitutae bacterium]|nr:DUF58 domain-containing protein [Opitutae bacterium]
RNKKSGTDLNDGLRFVNNVLRRRAVIFFLSDFIIPENKKNDQSAEDLFFKEISSTRKKHDLVCGQVFDFCEEKFPNLGLVQIEDAESGERVIIDSANANFREEYSNQRKEFQDRFVQRLKRRGIDFFSFSTDSDFVKVLKEFFQMRKSRRNR